MYIYIHIQKLLFDFDEELENTTLNALNNTFFSCFPSFLIIADLFSTFFQDFTHILTICILHGNEIMNLWL